MEHKPSNYIGTIHMTIQQMMEVHKAIRARLVFLSIEADDEQYPYKDQDIQDLIAVAKMLDVHEDRAVNEWEDQVVTTEAQALNDVGAIEEFLKGDEQ